MHIMHTRVLLIASSTRVVHKFMYRRSACAYNNIYIYNIRLVMITGILGISTQDARLRSSRCRNERLSAPCIPSFSRLHFFLCSTVCVASSEQMGRKKGSFYESIGRKQHKRELGGPILRRDRTAHEKLAEGGFFPFIQLAHIDSNGRGR